MPIVRKLKWLDQLQIGIWRLDEPESFFLDRMDLNVQETEHLTAIKGHRRLEWLGGRWLLHLMTGASARIHCVIDDFGKPQLNDPDLHMSISHSHGLVAVALGPAVCGIDIQKQVSKINRIEHKFMRSEESEALSKVDRLAHLHVYWGAKESLYKAYGRKKLDYKQHLYLEAFEYKPKTPIHAWIHKADYRADFQATFDLYEEFILVAVAQSTAI